MADKLNISATFKVILYFALILFGFITIVGCSDSRGLPVANTHGPIPSPSPQPNLEKNSSPVAIISFSLAVEGSKTIVTLDGNQSFDPDGNLISFEWSQVDGESVVLSSNDQSVVTFIAPDKDSLLLFQLIVIDSNGKASWPSKVAIPTSAESKGIFVSANHGSDNAKKSGSYDEPVKTINYAISLAIQRDISNIYVMPGTYEESVSMASDINILGGVTSIDQNGNPITSKSGENSETIIQPKNHESAAVTFDNIENSSIRNIAHRGTTNDNSGKSIIVDHSDNVIISNTNLSTPCPEEDTCKSISIDNSSKITITGNTITPNNSSFRYHAISINNSSEIKIISTNEHNTIHLDTVTADIIRPIAVTNSEDVLIEEVVIKNFESTKLSTKSSFIGISLLDTTEVIAKRNSIEIAGGDEVIGILLSCSNKMSKATIESNKITLSDAEKLESGINIHCAESYSSIDLQQNFIKLESNATADLIAFDITSMNRPISLDIVNNIAAFPLAENNTDSSNKTGVNLEFVANNSSINIIHNSFIITGATGTLSGVSIDSGNLKLDVTNNLFFIYGGNLKNSVFTLPKVCGYYGCSKISMVNNFFNSMMKGLDLPLIYFFDTLNIIPMKELNSCIPKPGSQECEIKNEGNVTDDITDPGDFDFSTGTLNSDSQFLVKDLGTLDSNITVDINNNSRGQNPDIGATEY